MVLVLNDLNKKKTAYKVFVVDYSLGCIVYNNTKTESGKAFTFACVSDFARVNVVQYLVFCLTQYEYWIELRFVNNCLNILSVSHYWVRYGCAILLSYIESNAFNAEWMNMIICRFAATKSYHQLLRCIYTRCTVRREQLKWPLHYDHTHTHSNNANLSKHSGCDVIIITYEQWFWYWKPYAISTQIHILWVRLARSEPVSPIDKACFSAFTGFSNSVLPGCESMRQTRILCYMVGDLRWSMCVRFNRSLSPQQCLKCHKIRVPHVFPQAFSICIRLTITCTICSAPVQ